MQACPSFFLTVIFLACYKSAGISAITFLPLLYVHMDRSQWPLFYNRQYFNKEFSGADVQQ
ncbi:hypothetical protein CLOLEP_00878 [[Clostridium] leptum DSM 753]|uniref:Uncharacterized protein n=1 Tax=[Clostridium] leptum DSM 753 TaxID=428125 RepID=A7VQP8_9FIRM|nr:hypothetical protein CLOLEP_00878 [[Clostridium] leptum DSM 753]